MVEMPNKCWKIDITLSVIVNGRDRAALSHPAIAQRDQTSLSNWQNIDDGRWSDRINCIFLRAQIAISYMWGEGQQMQRQQKYELARNELSKNGTDSERKKKFDYLKQKYKQCCLYQCMWRLLHDSAHNNNGQCTGCVRNSEQSAGAWLCLLHVPAICTDSIYYNSRSRFTWVSCRRQSSSWRSVTSEPVQKARPGWPLSSAVILYEYIYMCASVCTISDHLTFMEMFLSFICAVINKLHYIYNNCAF